MFPVPSLSPIAVLDLLFRRTRLPESDTLGLSSASPGTAYSRAAASAASAARSVGSACSARSYEATRSIANTGDDAATQAAAKAALFRVEFISAPRRATV